MKSKQQGVTVVGMIIIAGLIVFGSVMGLKLVPAYIEYVPIRNHLRDLARAPDTRDSSVPEIMSAFDRRAQIDDISVVRGSDLAVVREGGATIISVEYSKTIHMVGNISALLDFEVTSNK